ncbi:MAG: hypothetical protein A3G80_01010 [Betaproteobacteria bacterium RIFCSPLOWO2_12_FULL_62_13b]|nr:MAG: hypothetical protein A3G80_01010 [Betaproteobacteria bacterium RIFCSPLOWO2_12_FULL_62_13b]
MSDDQRVLDAVYSAVDEANLLLPSGKQMKKAPGVALRGDSSPLDSLGLVNLLLAVERQVEGRFGAVITLFDERVFSNPNATLKDIRTLAGYVRLLLAEKQKVS